MIRPRSLALGRTKPLSDVWGADRGSPIHRYYVERFLEANRQAIQGSVLEVERPVYTERFGVGVRESHVLDTDVDLGRADAVPDYSFDCLILTQTLQFVYDVRAAVSHCHRVLRPGGVLLCTVPSVARIDPGAVENEYWRFTAASCNRLFGEAFDGGDVVVTSHGNVLACVASPRRDRCGGARGAATRSRRILPTAPDRAGRAGGVGESGSGGGEVEATKYVIVNADDFGLSSGINRGIVEAHERGIVTSTSLMVDRPGAEEGAAYARAHPELGVGLHVELPRSGARVPRRRRASSLELTRRQLDRFRSLVGRDPTHVDSHRHRHRHEPARSAVAALAGELGVRRRRARPHDSCGDFYGQSYGRIHSTRPDPDAVGVDALVRLLEGCPRV